MRNIFLIAYCLISFEAHAGDKKKDEFPPRGFGLIDLEERSWLSFECEYVEKSKRIIDCEFTQASLRLPDPSKEKELLTYMEKAADSEKKTTFMNACKNKSNIVELTTAKTSGPKLKEAAQMFIDMCNANDHSKLLELFRVAQALDSKTCGIGINKWQMRLQKSGENGWISDASPKGLCDISNVTTLKHEPDSNSLWTFTQMRVAVGGSGEMCDGFKKTINQPKTFTWNGPTKVEADCSFFKMSPY